MIACSTNMKIIVIVALHEHFVFVDFGMFYYFVSFVGSVLDSN